jgi:NADPH-dependent 2,4-dienoyl-CoA reductase/sulfur reductase-like enzyme
VLEIDLAKRRLRVRETESGTESWESFDQLVIATGTLPIRPQVPGIDSAGIYGVHTLEDGIKLRRVLDAGNASKVAIVGGGYIGIEMAEAMIERGLEVVLIDMLPQLMGTLDPDMAALVSDAVEKTGISLALDEKLEGFEAGSDGLRSVITDRRRISADIAILGLGVRPNTKLAEDAGLALGLKRSIKVNDRMQTGADGVWAVGDCVESYHLVSRQPFWVALGTVANKQGRVAGINIGGGGAVFPGVVGTAATKFCATEIARTGLQKREIEELGLDYAMSRIEGRTRAGYYPGKARIVIKLYGERKSLRLLGAQIVGGEGSAKRIDVLATALHSGLTVPDIIGLDLAYAPPYSTVWDPIQIAARQLGSELTN